MDEEDVEQIKITGNEKKDSGSLLTKILTIVFFISLFVLLLAGTATVSILMRNFMDRSLNVGTGAGGTGGSMDSNCSELTDNAKQYIGFVNSAAQKYGVDPALVAAIIQQESGWNPNAESSAGAQGMMQLMPGTAAGLGVTNSFDPEQNINGGTQYIKQQLDRFGGNIDKAIAAYNAGPGAVEQYGGVPPYKETQNYVKNVKDYYEKYKKCLTGGGSGQIVDIARNELGTVENPPYSDKVDRPYNINDQWCASFARWVYQQAGYNPPQTNNAMALYDMASKDPNFTTFRAGENTPQPGDLVFFSWGDYGTGTAGIQHVGIVESVNADGTINTIEGNTSTGENEGVASKIRTVSSTTGAVAFARPK